MTKWKLCIALLFVALPSSLALAQSAYDDEAFEESADVLRQRLDEEFNEAIDLMNERGIGAGVREFKRLAVEGHYRSQHLLGMFFRYGTGVRKNAKRSVQWLKLSAEQRYPGAMLAYAEAAIVGEGMSRDYDLARELLEPVASLTWNFPVPMEDFSQIRSMRSEASYLLATLLVEGKGGDKDVSRAIELMETASKTGSLYATMYLAVQYAKGELLDRDLVAARRYYDLVELQVFDSMRRTIETVMMGFSDPVVEEEIREEAEEMGKQLTKELVASQRNLALELLDKQSEDYDPVFASGLLKLAAEGGDSLAQQLLGRLYWDGSGVDRDEKLAKKWFKEAAEAGQKVGIYNDAILMLKGDEDEESKQAARQALNDIADSGHYAAQLVLDEDWDLRIMSDNEDLELAEERSDQGDPRAIFAILKRGDLGWKVKPNYSEKVRYKRYLKLAKGGYHRAQLEVGRAHYEGRGTKLDFEKAREWFELAAEKGNQLALFRLGYIYGNSEGVALDWAKALEYYKKSFDLGNVGAANNLANLYFEGKGVAIDKDRAMELYLLAAEDGSEVACYNIGRFHIDGSFGDDPADGVDWLAKAAEEGYKKAIFDLLKYYKPESETEDSMEFIYWVERAAEIGDQKSMKLLALLYHDGVGVPVSKMKSMQWIVAYLQQRRFGAFEIRKDLLKSENWSAISAFAPADYEAVLLYANLLNDDSWAGYNKQAAFEIAKVFAGTGLFAGRLLLAELHLVKELKGARPKVGIRIYEDVYEEALENRFLKQAVMASYALGRYYGDASNEKWNERLQFEWMKKAADIGFKRAQFLYAGYMWEGKGCEKDTSVALAYWVKLANEDYINAILRLGELLADRESLDQDLDRAQIELKLKQLAQIGNARAKSILRALGIEIGPEHNSDEEGEPSENRSWRPTVVG